MALPYKPPAGARQNFCAAPKIRTEQAPLSKGARAEIGGLPPGKLPPPGALPKRAPPSANGISRRSNPSVLASLGHLPLTREAKTAPAAVNRADMESAPTGVAFPQGSAGRCKHRPLHRFVIAHGRSHPGRPQHRRARVSLPRPPFAVSFYHSAARRAIIEKNHPTKHIREDDDGTETEKRAAAAAVGAV